MVEGLTLQRLFQREFGRLSAQRSLLPEMYHAAWCVSHCRTACLGGHMNVCPDGHHRSIAYNSCGHRSCPQCGWLETQRWLEGQRAKLLPCGHHHLVFTLPSELIPIWRFNRAAYAQLLFHVVQETLKQLLADPKYLGGRPGLLCGLHTWNQLLQPHVHLHCLVTAGGLDTEGNWVLPKKRCLLPRKVLMLKFRGKFLALLRQAVADGKLQLPRGMTDAQWRALQRKVVSKSWNVKIHERYEHGQGVATYLARYLKSGPIKNHRLMRLEDGQVHFRYRVGTHAGGDGKRQEVTQLPVSEFLLRWLWHVPPKGLQTIRGYGLYSGNQHSQLDVARGALGLPTAEAEDAIDQAPRSWQDLVEELVERQDGEPITRCPQCGRRLVRHREIKPTRGPPQAPWASRQRKAAA